LVFRVLRLFLNRDGSPARGRGREF